MQLTSTYLNRFVAGPPLVEHATHEKLSKEELGGWSVCCKNGSVDNAVQTEQEAFATIRKWLSYLPSNIHQLPPRQNTKDPINR